MNVGIGPCDYPNEVYAIHEVPVYAGQPTRVCPYIQPFSLVLSISFTAAGFALP